MNTRDTLADKKPVSGWRNDQETRLRAESLVLERTDLLPNGADALSPQEVERLVHELRVHQIELEMQNDELRRAQGGLEAAEGRYRDLYEQAPVGYCTLDPEGLIQQANLTAATLLGLPRGELLNQPLARFLEVDDLPFYYGQLKRLFVAAPESRSAASLSFELRLLRPDGAHRWGHFSAIAADEAGSGPMARVVLSDITARKAAEAEAQRNAECLQRIIDHSPALIYVMDLEGRLTLVSRSVAEELGRSPRELIGKTSHDLLPQESADRHRANDREVIASRKSIQAEETAEMASGLRTYLTTKFPLFDDQGRLYALCGSSVDITDRKAAEEELRRRNEELERFNRASVGRELRMIELKREVNALAQALGRPPPYDLAFADEANAVGERP